MSNKNDDENLDKTNIVPSDTFKMKMEKIESAPPCLVLLMGPINQIGRQWPIVGELTMGRALDADICIDDRSVSRNHFKVYIEAGNVYVEDIGSSNGTEVDGGGIQKLEPHQLSDNIQIKAGNVIFKFLEQGNIEAVTNQASFDRAQVDALTQIYNKRAFLDKVEETFKRAKLMDIPLCLIVFDLDKFKAINDNFGHRAGDYVLKEVSSLIKKQQRPGDFFARYGGEEFTLLLGGTDLQTAIDVADRIRKLIEKHSFHFEGTDLPVTISLGVSSLSEEISSWEDLFEIADKGLYKSKQDGRNRVSHLQNP